jgi:hypothetical protein
MDQQLLDASQFRITSLSLDTRFATTYYTPEGIYKPEEICDEMKTTTDVMWRLNTPIRNVMRIAMSSVELPEVEYLFSDKHGNLNFTVTLGGGSPVTLTIDAGNYTATELAAAIQGALTAGTNPPGFSDFVAGVNANIGKLTIAHPSLPFTFYGASSNATIAARPKEWGLGYNIGMRQRVVSSTVVAGGGFAIVPIAIVRIQPSPYYLLQLMIPDQVEATTHQLPQGGSVPAFAKLVLRENWYYLQFDDNSNLLRKEFTFLTPVNVSTIRMRLLDAYGVPVQIFDLDWSVSLEIYEVTNAKQFNAIGKTYSRN